ncbi:orotidine-5'-phosphate decarboxylase [Candidatus Gracilibacteria bacterium]|nr:orotidine-5'-phosphate decarboxylase [Candidatus Gracilibacteria bacterium]
MPKLNIAFDGKTPDELKNFIHENKEIFAGGNIHIKLNDLIAETGIEGIKILREEIQSEIGVDIIWMIDGKWNDIPNTVANYVKRLKGLNVAYYTVHASGGPNMIQAAKVAVPDLKLLAITVLTSLEENEVVRVFDAHRNESVLRLAKVALDAGADGLVCSPADAPMLRQVFGKDFLLVTPNIQREGIERKDDQNKALTNTPGGAIENGASDIVVGRPILNANEPSAVIKEMLDAMSVATPKNFENGDFGLEKALYRGSWDELLKYIGAIYVRPEGGKYVRYTSGLIANAYTNNGVSERDYRVLHRAGMDLMSQMETSGIQADLVMGAQMGSVRLSLSLADVMSITESIYTEKVGDEMLLKRHDLGEGNYTGRKVVLSEDVITKGSTIAKMIEIVKAGGGEVVAITCIVNRSGKDNFQGIPLFHCYVPQAFDMWWDDETLVKTRANEMAAGKTPDEIERILQDLQVKYPRLPEGAVISEKPKNEWNELVKSMR